ncbi:class I adenylate-forming enzyme family protein [Rhodococcus opacus]|uniref:class I adenylate-forming enzyme family protein n=1 Tax=Rhodococcus opacus TaxID=37919 RepID=UPI0029491353|nr:class I adenylate-forming enzyme family protein [Rhodococcus opacus]MDV6247465.1 class I adenylate-forming enzyme family protein [Rhodococcus opacus]
MNIATSFQHVASARSTKVALQDDDTTLTYGELDDLSARVASFLVEQSITPGDRVGVYMSNCVQYIVLALGIWKAGAVLVPFNIAIPRAPLRHAVEDSGVRFVFADTGGLDRFTGDCDGLDVVGRVVHVSRTATPSAGERPAARWSYEDVIASDALSRIVPRMDDENALLMYTSGSTGKPKGVQQTHRNTAAVVAATIDAWGFSEADHAVICTPFFHVGGMQLMVLPMLLSGASAYTLPRWNAEKWRQAVIDKKATYTALVPTMVVDIANAFESNPADLTSLRVCAIGGSVLPTGPVERFVKATGITTAVNIYGQTEQMGVAVCERPGEQVLPRSLGRPLEQIVQWRLTAPGTDEEVTDEHEAVGELHVRGDAVTPGYWNLPEVNAEKISDGWLRTGDLVRIDRSGVMHYVERIDEMIISGGENVYPQMIENCLASCPDVAEVAVIGTYHERWMQQVTAIVVPRSPDVSVADIAAYCAQHPDLQGLQRPRRIELVDALPRTGNNKVDRPQLKRTFT